MALIAVIVVAAASFTIYRLHGIFGSHTDAAAESVPDEIVPFHPKQVLLEVFGDPGTVATINYLDVHGVPQQVLDTTLPWSHTITTTQPAVFANLVAQGAGDFIGCRITTDGVVKDERTVRKVTAYTFCLDKSA